MAGGALFEAVLNFRVAVPSRFFEGTEGLAFSRLILNAIEGAILIALCLS